MSAVDEYFRGVVDDIWAEFDKDGSGVLEKDEAKKCIQSALSVMEDADELSEADFEECFKEFDKNGNGTIEKDEMIIFLKKVGGVWSILSRDKNLGGDISRWMRSIDY